MRKTAFLTVILMFLNTISIYCADFTANAKSAIIMEGSTGQILFEQNPDERLAPASVTKIMTLIMIYDSINDGKIKWDDVVTVSEHASSMGGSQIFLEPNEQQTVKELTKSIIIASANDSAVAMAEFIGTTEEGFVNMMNKKAVELGMTNTHFENACGLDTDNHLTTARDIAVMSRYLIVNYPQIKEFTTKWQDTVIHKTARGSSEFGLTNTNKLIKQYPYATGLKTGSTSKALYCLSATAEKDGLSLITVIMAAPDPKTRFQEASKLLDYGFTNYSIATGKEAGTSVGEIRILKGKEEKAEVYIKDKVSLVVKKGNNTALTEKTELSEGIEAPVESGTKVGEIIYYSDGNEVGRSDITIKDRIEKATMGDIIKRLAKNWFL